MQKNPKKFLPVVAALAAATAMTMPLAASAQSAPLSYMASPDAYKLLAENDQFRVVLATWKPGQRDAQHSHSPSVAYRLTDCKSRIFDANGKVTSEGEAKAGSVVLQPQAIGSHSFENTGSTACQTLLVEKK